MSDSSIILPLVVGAINPREENSIAQVDCEKKESTDSDTASIGVYEVLYPQAIPANTGPTGGSPCVPLLGGTVVKIPGLKNVDTSIISENEVTKARNERLKNRLEDRLKPVLESVNSADAPGDSDISNLTNLVEKLRMPMNKFFNRISSMDLYDDIANIYLSSYFDAQGSYEKDIDKFQNALDRYTDGNVSDRDPTINVIGRFSFIPFETLHSIVQGVGASEGFSNLAGNAGVTFSSMALNIEDEIEPGTWVDTDGKEITDSHIARAVLEFFPIYNMHEDDIFKGGSQDNLCGFFTVVGENIYLKMPNLSGQDSSGLSSNIYGLGDIPEPGEAEEDENLFLLFELEKDEEEFYRGVSITYQPPPSPKVLSRFVDKPGIKEELEIEMDPAGIDYENSDFYLSPIMPNATNVSVRGLKTSTGGIEIFTAPVLSRPFWSSDYMSPRDNIKEEDIKAIVNFELGTDGDLGAENENRAALKHITGMLEDQVSASNIFTFGDVNFDVSETNSSLITSYSYIDEKSTYRDISSMGLPLLGDLSAAGISKMDILLGEKNRPEMLLGLPKNIRQLRSNNRKYFNRNTGGTKELLISNKPSVYNVTENRQQGFAAGECALLPEMWKRNKSHYINADGNVAIVFKGIDFIDIRTPGRISEGHPANVKFALYIMDRAGQLVRAPGPPITMEPKFPYLEPTVDPNTFDLSDNAISISGYLGSDPLNIDTLVSSWKIRGEGLLQVKSIEIWTGIPEEDGASIVTTLYDGDDVGTTFLRHTDTLIEMYNTSTLGEWLSGGLRGELRLRLVDEAGNASRGEPIYISDNDVLRDELPPVNPDDAIIKIMDPLHEFKPLMFDSEVNAYPIVECWPIASNGTSGKIKVKSSSQLFKNPDAELYAYPVISADFTEDGQDIGDIMDGISFPSRRVYLNGLHDLSGNALSVSTFAFLDVYHKFSASSSDSFGRLSNKKAYISFPGGSFVGLNFSGFEGLKKAFILITSKKLEDFGFNSDGGDGALEARYMLGLDTTGIASPSNPVVSTNTRNRWGLIQIGGGENGNPAFIGPPIVSGLIAKVPGKPLQSSILKPPEGSELLQIIRDWDMAGFTNYTASEGGPITAGSTIESLIVMAQGAHESEVGKRYKYFFNGKKMKKNILRELKSVASQPGVHPPLIVGKFGDIDTKAEGFLPVEVRYKSKAFHTTFYSSHFEKIIYEVNKREGSMFETLNSGNIAVYNCDWSSEDHSCEKNSENIDVTQLDQVFEYEYTPVASTVLTPTFGTQWNELYANKELITKYNSPIQIVPVGMTMGFALFTGDASEFEVFEIDQFGLLRAQGTLAALSSARGIREQGDALAALKNQVDAIKAAGGALADIPADLQEDIAGLQDSIDAMNEAAESTRASSDSEANADDTVETEVTAEDMSQYADVGSGGSSALEDAASAVEDAAETLDEAVAAVNGAIEAAQGVIDDVAAMFDAFTDALSSAAGMLNQLAGEVEDAVNNLASQWADRDPNIYFASKTDTYLPSGSEFQPNSLILNGTTIDDVEEVKVTIPVRIENGPSIKCNVPEIVKIRDSGNNPWFGPTENENFDKFPIQVGKLIELEIENAKRDIKIEIAGKRIKKRTVRFSGTASKTGLMNVIIKVPDSLQGITLFGSGDCVKITASNTNVNTMGLARQIGNDFAIDLDKQQQDRLFGSLREKTPNIQDLIDRFQGFPLRLPGGVVMDQIAAAKEHIKSFCDLSFYLTAQLDLSLRNFKWILIPIKIILCIIDVICALLNPWKLAAAIVRLFLCLWDLLLLLPQISVPVMFLMLVLHLLELLQCVLIKIITTITAINEIIAALDTAITMKNYPAIMALEETINEHIFALEADLSVLQPIIQILMLFLELLQLLFNFPCRIADETISPTCIDPSLLAGILIGKAAPNGEIVADNLLPIAQSYTTLRIDNVGVDGNTPSNSRDDGDTLENAGGGTPSNILEESSENEGKVVMTRELSESEAEGLTEEELEAVTYLDATSINSSSLRTTDQDFEATFAVSFTKSTKGFSVFTGPDPRIVNFEFKERGLTNNLAWTPFISIFFRKKTIDHLQPLDSPPRFLQKSGDKIKVARSSDDLSRGIVSPIDGVDQFLNGNSGSGFHPKPLTVTLVDKVPTGEVDEAGQPEFEDREYEQTFDGIPMFAIIDEEFNVYFIRDNGIKVEGGEITSIEAMMINLPSAPKLRSSREDREVFRDVDGTDGETIVKKQANADYIIGSDPLGEGFGEDAADEEKVSHSKGEIQESYPNAPYQDAGSYNYMTKTKDRKKLEASIDSIKVFDFPQLYLIDIRQAADELASACNASSLNNLLMGFALGDVDFPADDGSGDVDPTSPSPEDIIENQLECTKEFLQTIRDEIDALRAKLSSGLISKDDQISIFKIREAQQKLEDCCRKSIDDICIFVVNPLNTGFKVLEDENEDPLPGFIDPEEYSEDPFLLEPEEIDLEDDDELEIESHKITGAREYAAGIGDMAVVDSMRYATIEIIPRDSYDAPIPGSFLEKISVEIVKDETGGAELVVIEDDNYEVSESGFIAREEGDTTYYARITSNGLGKVTLRGSVCSKTIRAVTLAGLKPVQSEDSMGDDFGVVDCIPDSGAESDDDSGESFAPGQLTKIDRILTVIFKEPGISDGDGDGAMGLASAEDIREESAESAKARPQGTGSNLDN